MLEYLYAAIEHNYPSRLKYGFSLEHASLSDEESKFVVSWLASVSDRLLSMVTGGSLLRTGVSEVSLQIEDSNADVRDGVEDSIHARDEIDLWVLALCS